MHLSWSIKTWLDTGYPSDLILRKCYNFIRRKRESRGRDVANGNSSVQTL